MLQTRDLTVFLRCCREQMLIGIYQYSLVRKRYLQWSAAYPDLSRCSQSNTGWTLQRESGDDSNFYLLSRKIYLGNSFILEIFIFVCFCNKETVCNLLIWNLLPLIVYFCTVIWVCWQYSSCPYICWLDTDRGIDPYKAICWSNSL